MSDYVGVTAVVGIVAIVAITFGFVFRAKIGYTGVEIESQPCEEDQTKSEIKPGRTSAVKRRSSSENEGPSTEKR
jgi:hypothetical protein